jgi:hypothetical protein
MGILVIGIGFVVGGVVGLLNPDPTPGPALPADPAQQIVFCLMIAGGLVVDALVIRGLIRDWQERRRVSRGEPRWPSET